MSYTTIIKPRGRTFTRAAAKPAADPRPKPALRPILHLKSAAEA